MDEPVADPAAAAHDLPDVGELLDLVEQLDADNERLRLRVLELMELMEAAVNREVAGERRIAELEHHVTQLEAEVEALHDTKLMRAVRPLRELYGRVLASVRGRG